MNKQPRPIDWRKVTLASVFSAVILIDAIKLIDFQTTSNCRKQVDLASLRETGIELTRPGGGQTVDDNVLARKIAAGLELMQQTTYGKRILERVDPETGVRMDFLCTDYTAYYNPTSYRNPMAYHSRAKNGIYICRSGLDDGIAATMAHEARHSLFPKIGSQDTVSMRLSMHLLDEMIAYGTGTRVAFEAEEIAPGAWDAFKNDHPSLAKAFKAAYTKTDGTHELRARAGMCAVATALITDRKGYADSLFRKYLNGPKDLRRLLVEVRANTSKLNIAAMRKAAKAGMDDDFMDGISDTELRQTFELALLRFVNNQANMEKTHKPNTKPGIL